MDATSADYARAAFDLIDDFEHTRTPEEVVEQLASSLSLFGFSTVLITGVPEPPQRVEPYFLMNGWPRGWSGHNANANNYADNPAAAWCRRTIDPFEWSEGTGGSKHSAPAPPCVGSEQNVGMTKHYLVPVIHCTDGAGPRRELTLREREVLQWIAAGKSSWDVSVILGISERTVNWLISRAGRKLNAVNRTHAVVNAIRAGQIYI